jgi:hypothetical protein
LKKEGDKKSTGSESQSEAGNEPEVDGDHAQEGEEEEEDKAASWKSWTKFRVNAAKMCEILMNRKLQEWEKVCLNLLKRNMICFSSRVTS